MPSAMTSFAAFDKLERACLADGHRQPEARAARLMKRALEPMVGEQVVEEASQPVRRLRLPTGRVVEIGRFE